MQELDINEISKAGILDDLELKVYSMRVVDGLNFSQISRKVNRSPPQTHNIYVRCKGKIDIYLTPQNGDTLITSTTMNRRIKNALIDLNISYVKELNGFSSNTLISIRNLGMDSVNEIQGYLSNLGFSLKLDHAIKNPIVKNRTNFEFLLETIENTSFTKGQFVQIIQVLTKSYNEDPR